MAIFGIGRVTKPAPLVTTLAVKGSALRKQEEQKRQSSQYLIDQAAREAEVARTAGTHAVAVEKALEILDQAGVTV